MKIINLGILAHVDAGKTTLTESLLYTSGAIAELGSVDEGTTRTDTMNLERQRGITIQTAVTSFQWEDVKNAKRNVPLGMILSLLIILGMQSLLVLGYSASYNCMKMARTSSAMALFTTSSPSFV
jgi:hypothetical protein